MPGIEDDLRATSDVIISDARTLVALEEEKRPIDPTDPALVPISNEIEELAERLVHETAVERRLAKGIRAERSHDARQ